MRRRLVIPLLALMPLTLPSAAAAAPGALSQLPEPFGCHVRASLAAGTPCRGIAGFRYAADIAVSPTGGGVFPSGGNVYVVSRTPGNAIATLQRNAASGNLTQLGGVLACHSNTGPPGHQGQPGCASGRALRDARAVVVSPDGVNVYVAGRDGVAVFYRPSGFGGALAQVGGKNRCISTGGDLPGADDFCRTTQKAMTSPLDLAVSPDGKHVYVASYGASGADAPVQGLGSGVTALRRTTASGGLGKLSYIDCDAQKSIASESGCDAAKGVSRANGVAISPDGKHVYVTSQVADAVAVFSRNSRNGKLTQLAGSEGCVSNDTGSGPFWSSCKSGTTLDDPLDVAVSPDGEHVYVASGSPSAHRGTAIFARDPDTGALGQVGCVNDTGAGGCTNGVDYWPRRLAVSPEGGTVYVASHTAGASATGVLNVFSRDPATGLLSPLPIPEGCLSQNPASQSFACGLVGDLGLPDVVAVSPDGRNVYAGTRVTPAAADGRLVSFARDFGPECKDKTVDNQGGSGADIQLECADPLGKPLTYAIVSQPDKGNVTIDQATAIASYVPNASFVGPDPFTFKASNGMQESNVATITVNNVAG